MQWCLLEHAFDTILEAGEIPHPSFFMEMVVQATAQHGFERAVTLVNTIAYAPFQVGERQWIDLFKNNGDRISKDSLVKLLDALGNCEVASEASVSNLLRCLQSICCSGTLRTISTSSALANETSEKSSVEGCDKGFNRYIGGKTPSYSGIIMDENLKAGDRPLVKDGYFAPDIVAMNNANTNREVDADSETILCPRNQGCGMDQETCDLAIGKVFADDVASAIDPFAGKLATFMLNGNTNDLDEAGLETLMNRVDSCNSDLPTADEILESWKESRKKDGILFPFQLGRK